jgi:hypothetical protein
MNETERAIADATKAARGDADVLYSGQLALLAIDLWKERFLTRTIAELATMTLSKGEFEWLIEDTARQQLRDLLVNVRLGITNHRGQILEHIRRKEE